MFDSTIVLAQAGGTAESAAASPAGIVVVGFLFVILVLALLASVTAIMGAIFNRQAAQAAARAAEAAQAAAEATAAGPGAATPTLGATSSAAPAGAGEADEADDPAITAVIAAAIHTVIGDRPHRVVSVRSSGPGWAQEGRRQIFSSHRVR
jgi:Oxaloacetate decarboxylase, gamma chain.